MRRLSLLIKKSGCGFLARGLRTGFYYALDIAGDVLFFILRSCGALEKIKPVNLDIARKILIIRLDRIGDVILSTPAIRAVKNRFPKAQVHLLIREYTKDLVICNPNIDKLLIYKKDICAKDYDIAIALHPGLTQNYLVFASGAKARIGYTGRGGGFFLTRGIKDDRAKRVRHEVESALEVVAAIGCRTDDSRLEVSLSEEGEQFAADFFRQHGLTPNGKIIVVHPGARQEYIRWSREGFAQVADSLRNEKNAKIILIGSENERSLVKGVLSLMETEAVRALGLKLTQLVSLISRCNLFIGNSTGPMHIAAALGIPTVAIFGSQHPLDSYRAWGPWVTRQIVVSKDTGCLRCHPSGCRHFDCMKAITAEDVLAAARKLLS